MCQQPRAVSARSLPPGHTHPPRRSREPRPLTGGHSKTSKKQDTSISDPKHKPNLWRCPNIRALAPRQQKGPLPKKWHGHENTRERLCFAAEFTKCCCSSSPAAAAPGLRETTAARRARTRLLTDARSTKRHGGSNPTCRQRSH